MERRILLLLATAIVYLTSTAQSSSFDDYIDLAKNGNADAQYELAMCYYYGKGVSIDYNKALSWLKKSVEQNNAKAQRSLAWFYATGTEVQQNYTIAYNLYKKSAEQGDIEGQCYLGLCYFDGKGVKQDYNKAFYWLKNPAEHGNAKAQRGIGWCYYNGKGASRDYSKAAYWLSKSAEQGDSYSKSLLAECNKKGYGVNLNESAKVETIAKEEKVQITKVVTSDVDINIPKGVPGDGNTFVVIIGNEKYKNEADVPFAHNDAKIFKEYVNKTLGVSEKQIKYIEDAGLNDLRIAIRWLSQAMDVCNGMGKGIFYYAGHGIPGEDDKAAYLLPTDGLGTDKETAYSLNRLYSEFSKINTKRIAIFLDACFSGTKREGDMMASARGVAIKVKNETPKGNIVVFTAATDAQTAYPFKQQGHGMFTYYLLKKLKDSNGDITLGELESYLNQEVKRQSFIENNKMQSPTVSASPSLGANWRNLKLK